MNIDIKSMMKASQAVTMEVPGYEDFTVEVTYLGKNEMQKIREKCLKKKLNKKTRQMEDDLDIDLFQDIYAKKVLTGWSGLTIKTLASLILIEPPQGAESDSEVEYTPENAATLMVNSAYIDRFIADMLEDVENFAGNSEKS